MSIKNYGVVANDGSCVYYDSFIKNDRIAKLIIGSVNFIVLTVFSVIIWAQVSNKEKTSVGSFIGGLVLMFVLYFLIFGLISLWNLYGAERIIITEKSIALKKSFGFFSMPWIVKTIERPEWNIVEEGVENGISFGIINFFKYHEVTKLPMSIMSSSIKVPLATLVELHEHLSAVFFEQDLTRPDINSINLN